MSAHDESVLRRERLPGRVTALLGALLAAHAALAWQVRQREIFIGGDDAGYILLARSLRALTYREPQFIGEPIAARFPPGYPAMLAGWGSIFGERLDAFAALGIIASVVGLLALFDVIRRRWSPELALLVVAVTAINPSLVAFAGATGTETMFTALTLCSLWAADRAESSRGPGRLRGLAGALAIAAALTRSAGVTLGGALGLFWLRQRRWLAAVMFAVAFSLTVGSWLGWTVVAPKREMRRSYVDDAVNVRTGDGSFAGTMVARLSNNIEGYGGQIVISELQLPVTPRTRLDNVGWMAALGVLGVIGLVACWRRWNAAALYLLAYAGMLLVWPYTVDRFVAPVLPLLIGVILIGAWVVGKRFARRRPTVVAAAVAAALATFALVRDGGLVEESIACARTRVDCATPAALDFVDAARYIAHATPPDARFVAPKNATLFYYGHRQSSFWDEAVRQDSASFLPYVRENRISYVLATPVFYDYLELYRLLHQNCEYFDIVRAYSPSTMILAVRDVPRDDGRSAPVCTAMARVLARPPAE